MTRPRPRAGNLRWGWRCPRCDTDVDVGRDGRTDTFYWHCEDVDCPAFGIGFRSRRQARLGVLEYRERYRGIYR
ncbi:hypothetical protein [Natronococcus occultus]|uniref:hypothetical protein n=1 Tax=Natronococcus occultus TaxID=29288 RepID=UPI000677AD60|nr:hypothetical protein [Natronococcus occultus]